MDPHENPPPRNPSPSDPFDPAGTAEESAADQANHNPYLVPHQAATTLQANPAANNQRVRPRWWTSLAVAGVALAVFLLVSSVCLVLAVVIVNGGVPSSPEEMAEGLTAALATRMGLVLIVIPQFFMVAVPIAAAVMSPVETRQRLGLVRGSWPVWAWIAAALTTPLIGLVSGGLLGLFLEESEALKQMSEVFRGHGQSGFLFPLAMMIGLTPAICEELLFRGYIQTRLTKSFAPMAGIILSSFLFAAFHMDFVHVVAVFPLGLFLGWISWRSGSLFPAMMAHFVNNVISVVAVVMAPEDATDVLGLPTLMITSLILVSGLVGTGAVILASIKYGRPDQIAEATPTAATPTQLI
ncbi:MAG: CPBP family glutamic-type intramembrane protease [Rubripirellula sp.]